MAGKVLAPDVFVGDYNPLDFLALVREEVSERAPLVSTIVVVLDSSGFLTIHTSSPDRERNLGLLELAKRHALEEFGESVEHGYLAEPIFTPEGDDAA